MNQHLKRKTLGVFLALSMMCQGVIFAQVDAVSHSSEKVEVAEKQQLQVSQGLKKVVVKTKAETEMPHWSTAYAEKLKADQLMEGYLDGQMKLDQTMTVAECLSIVDKLIGYEIGEDVERGAMPFTDVQNKKWYADLFYEADHFGYYQGLIFQNKKIANPESPITREQFAMIVGKAFALDNFESVEATTSFTDDQKISASAKPYVEVLVKEGFLSGYPDGSFRPHQVMKRGEVAALTSKVYSEVYKEQEAQGTYDNLVINEAGMHLKDVVIENNLYITEGVKEGEVYLENVKVLGALIVKGGGVNSVHLKDCALNDVKVSKKDNQVRLVVEGASVIKALTVDSRIKLEVKAQATIETLKVAPQVKAIDLKKSGKVATIEVFGESVDVLGTHLTSGDYNISQSNAIAKERSRQAIKERSKNQIVEIDGHTAASKKEKEKVTPSVTPEEEVKHHPKKDDKTDKKDKEPSTPVKKPGHPWLKEEKSRLVEVEGVNYMVVTLDTAVVNGTTNMKVYLDGKLLDLTPVNVQETILKAESDNYDPSILKMTIGDKVQTYNVKNDRVQAADGISSASHKE